SSSDAMPATPPGTVPAPKPVRPTLKKEEETPEVSSPPSKGEDAPAEAPGNPLKTIGLIVLLLLAIGGGLAFFGRSIFETFGSDPEEETTTPVSTAPDAKPPAETDSPAPTQGRLSGALNRARA